MIWLTSDTHFGHANIIKYCARPFANTEEMDAALIKNWNERVAEDDIVYHLGDFAWGTIGYWEKIREKLNGEIHLIIGNHDEKFLSNDRMKNMFREITYQKRIWYGKHCLYLNHYPFLCFGGAYKGLDAVWQAFGHVHSNNRSDVGLDHKRLIHCFPTQYDVGVDNNNFAPISIEEFAKIMENRMMSLGMYSSDCSSHKYTKEDLEKVKQQ
jgi:calcineurin-like phosphoesterase family protein